MKAKKIHQLVSAAMLAALVCVATMIVQIPSPTKGYVNLGDCFVLLGAWLLGPYYGAAAAGIGSFLCDLLMSYAYYAPASLIIKALMAFCAAMLVRILPRRGALLISGIVAELVMSLGYFLFTALILGIGWGAALSIPGNLIQGAVGIVTGLLFIRLIHRTGLYKLTGCYYEIDSHSR